MSRHNDQVDRAATSGVDFRVDEDRGSVSNALLCRVLGVRCGYRNGASKQVLVESN